jgi:AcrR family transcriptional regulator
MTLTSGRLDKREPAVPRAKQRTPELRDHVLQVAVGILAAGGPTGFTTRKVAQQAGTSTPAVYELFGDKAGLVREMFFAGFRLLQSQFGPLAESGDPLGDLAAVIKAFRTFACANPALAELIFARPFADFDPRRGPPGRRGDRHRTRAPGARARAGGAGERGLARHIRGVPGSPVGSGHPGRAGRA